jgi:hypothetical protein
MTEIRIGETRRLDRADVRTPSYCEKPAADACRSIGAIACADMLDQLPPVIVFGARERDLSTCG